jgi:phage anti-repressor protein
MTSSTLASLTGSLDDKLVKMLQNELTSDEQALFFCNFGMYLKYDEYKDFGIDLEDVYEWIGYARVDSALRMIKKMLVEGKHYIIQKNPHADNLAEANKIFVKLCVNGFKQACMTAKTEKGERVREYYIKMESVNMMYIKEMLAERENEILSMALTIKATERNTRKARHESLLQAYINKRVVYIAIVKVNDDGSFVYKVGQTHDIHRRALEHKRDFGMFDLVDVFDCIDSIRCETAILGLSEFKKRKYTSPINTIISNETFLFESERAYESMVPVIKRLAKDHNEFMYIESHKLRISDTYAENERARIAHDQILTDLIIKGEKDKVDSIVSACKTMHEMHPTMPQIKSAIDPPIEPKEPTPVPYTKHRSTDKVVYQYNIDKTLVKIHEGFREAARDIEGSSENSI